MFMVDRFGIDGDVRHIGLDLDRVDTWSTREREMFAIAVGRVAGQRAAEALAPVSHTADPTEARQRRRALVMLEISVIEEVKRALGAHRERLADTML